MRKLGVIQVKFRFYMDQGFIETQFKKKEMFISGGKIPQNMGHTLYPHAMKIEHSIRGLCVLHMGVRVYRNHCFYRNPMKTKMFMTAEKYSLTGDIPDILGLSN